MHFFEKDVFKWQSDRKGRPRERDLPFTGPCSKWLQRPGLGQARPGQEPGTPSRSPTWLAGHQALRPSFAAFPGTLAETWIRNGAKKIIIKIFLIKQSSWDLN